MDGDLRANAPQLPLPHAASPVKQILEIRVCAPGKPVYTLQQITACRR